MLTNGVGRSVQEFFPAGHVGAPKRSLDILPAPWPTRAENSAYTLRAT
jgi:hypothetical protein